MSELYYGQNILIIGPSGAGKSTLASRLFGKDDAFFERVAFSPSFNREDLIGQYLPWMNGKAVEYRFQPGPFTRIWAHAMLDASHMYYLILEDIHHADIASALGEVFTLLDRDESGKSRYPVTMPMDMASWAYLHVNKYKGKIFIPANLTIVATMTSFQDAAHSEIMPEFWRRWNVLSVSGDAATSEIAKVKILDTGVEWCAFVGWVNEVFEKFITGGESKKLGPYFMKQSEFEAGADARMFANKLIGYIWECISQTEREFFFRNPGESFEALVDNFVKAKGEKRFDIFSKAIF